MNKIRLSLITLGVIGTSLSAAWIVNGVETNMEHPLQPPVRSIENGGNIPAIDAYEDGVGVFMKGSPGSDATQIDNSAFNRLVFKYGPAAKANRISIFDQVLSGTNTPPVTPEDIALANIIKGNTIASDFFADGTECDDQNPDTLNDIYTDGICMGTYINGTSCDDGNSETINDVYNGGICSGICDDGNPDTADSLQEDGTCLYQFIDGVACDDGDSVTYGDKYTDGVCSGSEYISCKAILDADLSTGDGYYNINPTGDSSFQVYCDMTNNGEVLKIISYGSEVHAIEAENYCSNLGLRLFVPKTKEHLTDNVLKFGSEYFRIMGIYPKFNGATCTGTFSSSTCSDWGTLAGDAWYVQDYKDVSEPNGDNKANESMYYTFLSDGTIDHYNDITDGYTSSYFVCSSK